MVRDLYVTGEDALTIYSLGDLGQTTVNARVPIPNNSDVALVANSFNVAPDEIVPGAEFDTLVWNLAFDEVDTARELTWQSTVSNLQPGESRGVVLDSMIEFVGLAAGKIAVAGKSVYVDQVLTLAPEQQTQRPGETSLFTLTIENPTDTDVSYDLTTAGVPDHWISMAPQANVPAGDQVDVPVRITSDPFGEPGEFNFVLSAASAGVTTAVEGSLVLAGEPVLINGNPDSHGVVISVDPVSLVAGMNTPAVANVRIINTGSVAATYDVSTSGLPAGAQATFLRDGKAISQIEVPPGTNNAREAQLRIVPATSTAAGDYSVGVAVTSAENGDISDAQIIDLSVLELGVSVKLSPTDPANGYVMEVTNTGTVTETFDVAVAAPAALFVSFDAAPVTLEPGVSEMIDVSLGNFEGANDNLVLVGTATSQSNPSVGASDSVEIAPPPSGRGVTAEFDRDRRTLSSPGTTSFLLNVKNIGPLEDQYTATITNVVGPAAATLISLDGRPTESIPSFILPGLSAGSIKIDAVVNQIGSATVTVEVRSLVDQSVVAEDTLTIFVSEGLDFGDAPEGIEVDGVLRSYPTRRLNDGARHQLVGGPVLGVEVDPEVVAAPSAHADGDGGDEDGVVAIASLVATSSVSTLGSFLVTASTDAKLDAWIDFDRNGEFDHPDEHLGGGISLDLVAGKNIVAAAVPVGSEVGATFARFRLSTAGGLLPTGVAQDGEVEDYRITILDGDAGAQATVSLIAGNVTLVADSEELVATTGLTELFRAPGAAVAGIDFIGTTDDNVVAVGDMSSASSNPPLLAVHGQDGVDAIRLTAGDQAIDLSSTLVQFTQMENNRRGGCGGERTNSDGPGCDQCDRWKRRAAGDPQR